MKYPGENRWLGVVIVCCCIGGVVRAQLPVTSDSERLHEQEELVQLLRRQNPSQQQRVGDLARDKARQAETPPHPQAATQGLMNSNSPGLLAVLTSRAT